MFPLIGSAVGDGAIEALQEGKPRPGRVWNKVPEEIGRAIVRQWPYRHNQNPRPFKWTASADKILASVIRFRHGTADIMRRTFDSRD
jgi:hypothetical protein